MGYLDKINDTLEELRTKSAPGRSSNRSFYIASAVEQLQADAQVIARCCEHQRNVVDQVVEISMLAAHKVSITPSSFYVQQVVEWALERCEAIMKTKSVKFSKYMPSVPLWIHSDRDRFRQITLNIVSNALNHMEPDDSLSIHLVVERKNKNGIQFVLIVKDTGLGYTEQELAHLCQQYIPIINSPSSSYETGGLALAVSKGLTQLLGGSMEIQSVKYTGTTFTLKFDCPVAEQYGSVSQAITDALVTGLSLSSHKKVMVVDDNRINLQILVRTIQKSGYECAQATDGSTAVEVFASFRPDLIFMDLQMPHKDGFEATAAIRAIEKDGRRTPIYALTGYARDEYKERALKQGMDGYLVKPFNRQEIKKILYKHLEEKDMVERAVSHP